MTRLDFVLHRVAFSGLPYGEVRAIEARLAAGMSWEDACLESTRDAGSWKACAYQAATLYGHDSVTPGSFAHILALRERAREAYAVEGVTPVRISLGHASTHGYIRRPADKPVGAVILFNGLDSIAEVELHAFASAFVALGMIALTVDLPANFGSHPRLPVFEVEHWMENLIEATGFDGPIGVFGVSFGGHMVCRALTSPWVAAGIAVSPPAYVGDVEYANERFASMFRLALGAAARHRVDVANLAPPQGNLLLIDATQDALFGPEHSAAIARWFGPGLEKITVEAEHVATSQVHRWLPKAAQWLANSLTQSQERTLCASQA